MLTLLAALLGGIGLFLLGMILMTDGLKALAGDALRLWLARFTRSRRSAVLTGAGVTLLVQSSSATTVATIGFVSAGLLSFSNAVGVIIGANIGTTSTGWIVALLGLKLSVGTLALPLIGVGALMKLLGRDKLAQGGLALAGFGVIFVGIDSLQVSMAGLSDHLDLSGFSAADWGGRLLLVFIGLMMSVIMQSSSAAVATTLAALSAGTIGLDQAAALVVGQNIGTTATGVLASLGGTTGARRTALVHVVFNLGTGVVAFLLLPVFVGLVAEVTAAWHGEDHALTIAAFHTTFSLLGAAIFLPLTPQLVWLAERLVKEREVPGLRHLDDSLHAVPALAVGAAEGAARHLFIAALRTLADRLTPGQPQLADAEALRMLDGIERFLADIRPPEMAAERARLLALVHLVDHLEQLATLAAEPAPDALHDLPALAELAESLCLALRQQADVIAQGQGVEPSAALETVAARLAAPRGGGRTAILEAASVPEVALHPGLALLAAHRWMDTIARHACRALAYLPEPLPSAPEVDEPKQAQLPT